MLYHMVMARKEVLVQLDDELVARLDELAAKAEISRSELIRRGMTAVLEAAEWAEADRELIAAYKRQPQDPLLTEALTKLAGDTSVPW